MLVLGFTTNAAAGIYLDPWFFTGDSNYNPAAGTVTDVIDKANAIIVVTPYNVTYDTSSHTAGGMATGVEPLIPADLSPLLDLTGTTHTGAGIYTDPWTFAGDSNYNATSGTVIDVIDKASAIIVITPYNLTYDGNPHTAGGTATGLGGVDLSSSLDLTGTTHTNAGIYPVDPWTFTDPNYVSQSGTVTDVIGKANASITVTGYGVTYDGNSHTAFGSATGVETPIPADLSGLLDLGSTTHTNAGIYLDPWFFAGDINYNPAGGLVVNTIAKADANIAITPYSVTYDANPHTAIGTATGVETPIPADLSGLLDLGSTTHTNAGIYLDPWFFAGDINYNPAGGLVVNTIAKADANIAITPYSVTYDANPHTAIGTATGVETPIPANLSGLLNLGATLHTNAGIYLDPWFFAGDINYNPAGGLVVNTIAKATANIAVTPYSVTYDANPHIAAGIATGVGGVPLLGLDLSGTIHTHAGNYTDPWTFTDITGNYNDAASTVNDRIAKADATIAVTPYSVTYDTNSHTATGTATGFFAQNLSGLDLGATTHTNAGTYNDAWVFTDVTGNYNDASGTVIDVIDEAKADVNVMGYDVIYDGNPHSATGSATGIGGVDLSWSLDLTGTIHTTAGDYTDPWTFTNPNYNNQSGTVNDVIDKAQATIDITNYHVTYDGNPHTAAGTATGIGGLPITGLVLTGTTHINAGFYTDPWTFTNPNYGNQSGTADDTIAKANATIVVTPYSVTYDGTAHTATGTATGVLGEPLNGLDLTGTTHTNAGSYAEDAWTFTDLTGNYNNSSGTVNDAIAKANAMIAVTPYSVAYDGTAHTATGTATGVLSEPLAGLDLTGTTHTNAGTYNGDAWTFTDVTGNYNNSSGTVDDAIVKAAPTIVVTPYSVTYDGNPHTADGTATGIGGVPLAGLDLSGTTHTNAGDYTGDSWTFTDVTGNYNDSSGTVNDVIAKADATIDVSRYSVTYDADATHRRRNATGIGGGALGRPGPERHDSHQCRRFHRRLLDFHRRHGQLQQLQWHGSRCDHQGRRHRRCHPLQRDLRRRPTHRDRHRDRNRWCAPRRP